MQQRTYYHFFFYFLKEIKFKKVKNPLKRVAILTTEFLEGVLVLKVIRGVDYNFVFFFL